MKAKKTAESLTEILRRKKIKVTDSRLRVLGVLIKAGKPVPIEYIYSIVKKEDINESTVYRILHTFLKTGLVREIHLSSSKAFFEYIGAGDHHHIICTSCGLIGEIDDCIVDEAKMLKKTKNFSVINAHSLEFFGLCKSCARK